MLLLAIEDIGLKIDRTIIMAHILVEVERDNG